MSKTVVVVQPYIAAYRRPFFLALRERLRAADINLVVAAGGPAGSQAARQDEVDLPDLVRLPEWRISFSGRSIAYRRLGTVVADADLVVLEQARRNLEMYQLLLTPHRNRRVALWGHGRTVAREASRLEHRLLDGLTKRADWFFAYTDAGSQHVVATGFPEDRCTIVRNSTDTRALRHAVEAIVPGRVDVFRREHGLAPGLTTLFVGGLDASKRIDFLVHAVGRIATAIPGFRLLVAGRGAEEAKVLTAQRAGSPLIFLGDCRGEDLALAARASEMILMPGRVGLIAVDSFALGLPVVTTNWARHAPEFDYLTPGEDSAVTVDDIDAFSSVVVELMSDTEERQRMQSLCRAKVADFSIDLMAANFARGATHALQTARIEA